VTQLTHGSLFDGFGGLRRGLEDAGFQTRWALDILNGHDITTESPNDYERVDLISGGPVCRKTSRAALWQGQKTNESLYPHMLRFVAHLRPGGVLIEQPASVDRSLILSWAADLERLGYGVAGRIIDSQHWVPQRRARWFLFGRMGRTGMEVWNDLYADSERVEGEDIQGSQGLRFDGNCPDCMRGGIFARVSSRRTALMGAGNGVTQPVAAWIGRRIIEVSK
jgi:site-specific DNA-cytosine methylase